MPRETFEPMGASRWDDLVRNDEETRRARQALDAGIILGLDTTIALDHYQGSTDRELVEALASGLNNEAWKLAFMSHMEAAMVAQELGVYESLTEIVDLLHWCRRAVGLSEEFATARWGEFSLTKNPGEPGLLISQKE